MDKYKVCVAQTTSYKDGKEYNIERAEGMIKEAAANGAALIVFPELYLTGYVASRRLPHHMEGSCSAKPGCRDMMGASLLG